MRQSRDRTRMPGLFVVLALAGSFTGAKATEGGGSTYPGGVENYLTGAAPPPGFHILIYGSHYRTNELRGNDGKPVSIPGFKVRASAVSPRLVWSTGYRALGGNVLFHTILPVVDLDVNAAGNHQRKTGLGDVTLGSGLAFHHNPHLHSVIALDLVAPTGGYDRGDLANIGRNYWTWQPLYTVSYVDPQGINGDFKITVNFNRSNRDNHYRSGNEIFVDYALGWGSGNGWVAGIGGYLTRQFSDDRLDGTALPGTRTRAFAIGPSVKYDNGKGWFIMAKWQKESEVRNRSAGSAFWVKGNIPF